MGEKPRTREKSQEENLISIEPLNHLNSGKDETISQ